MARASTKRGRPDGVMLDGALLRLRRTQLGLSQSGVADLARLGVRTVRTAEQGEPVSPDTAKLLASSMGLAYIELLRPPADLVNSQLLAHGFGALDPPDSWLPVDAQGPLRTALVDPEVRQIVVHGPPGVGKSSTAQFEVQALREQFPDGVVWIAADTLDRPERVNQLRLELADALGFRARLPDPAVVSKDAFDHAFQLHFWRWPRLLVLDSLQDPDVLSAFSSDDRGKLLVTTHTRWVADALDGHAIALPPWSTEQVMALLSDAVGAERLSSDPEGLAALLDLIGGLPLRAQLAATGLQRTRHQTPGDYIARIRGALGGVVDGAVDPRINRDPLVRGLLTGVGQSLPSGAIQAVQDLAVSAGTIFGTAFAEAAIGRPAAAVRGLLDVLTDAYVLREVEPGNQGARMRIEDWALGAWGNPSAEAVERVLTASPELVRGVVPNQRHDLAAVALVEHLPSIRAVLSAAEAVVGGSIEPARTPADLPVLPSDYTAVERMPELVLELTSLYRLSPTTDAGGWATLAAAVARERGDTLRYGKVAWLLGWWWYLRGDDLDAACAWGQVAADAIRETGTPDLVVSTFLHVGMIERARGGMPSVTARYQQTLEIARSVDCSPELMAAALLTRASSHIFGGGEPDWQAARQLAEQAQVLCKSRQGGRLDMLFCGATVVQAVCAAVLGLPTDTQLVNDCLAVMIRRLGGDGVMANSGSALVTRMGGTPDLPTTDARTAFLQTEQHHAEAMLQQLIETATQLGATSPKRHDDSLAGTPLGHLSPWVIAGFPLGEPPGPAFDVFLPVGPVRAMITGDNAEYAKRFVAAVRGPDHIAMVALNELDAMTNSEL